jgi:hypothetical protein
MSTKAQHTPGPWQVSSLRRENDGCYTYALGRDGETAAANAEFIVRACNAHDELLAACDYVDSVAPEALSSDTPATLLTITMTAQGLADLRAAIAKARGE